MKVAFVSTNSNSTPPLAYGGESYFWEIAKNVALNGHDVTLYATGGSETPPGGRLKLIGADSMFAQTFQPKGYEFIVQKSNKDIMVIKDYLNDFLEADIVHDCSHEHYVSKYLRDFCGKTNSINTLNGNCWIYPQPPFNMVVGSKTWLNNALNGFNGWEGTPYEKDYQNMWIGNKLKDARMIYWGTDTDFYCPSDYKKDDYILFFSRFHIMKGVMTAINLAKKMGFKLILAGSTDIADHIIYAKQAFEAIKGWRNIEFVNIPKDSRHHECKVELYRKARALLFPIQTAEPFGMVVTEALACGTPVIATKLGAMDEIIQDGITGYTVPLNGNFEQAIKDIDKIDPRNGVMDTRQRFDTKKLAKEYIKLYHKVIDGERW